MAASPLLISGAQAASGTKLIGDTGNTTEPLGRQIHLINAMVLQLTVTSGTGTLNVYLQHSLDGGTNWDDFVSFTQNAGSAAVYYAQWYRDVGPATAVHAKSDGALAAGSVLHGPVGDDWRIKYTIGTGPFTFSLAARQIQRVR